MIEIAQFAPQHAQGIIKLILPIQQDEFQIPITLGEQPDLEDIPGFYQQGNGNFWVALNDRKVVGTVALLDIGSHQAALAKDVCRSLLSRHRASGCQATTRSPFQVVPNSRCSRHFTLAPLPSSLQLIGSMRKTASSRSCAPSCPMLFQSWL